jgi:division protein 1
MSGGTDSHGRPLRQALDPVANPYLSSISSAANGTLSIAKEVLMGSFQSEYRRSESVRILSDRALLSARAFLLPRPRGA